MPEVKEHQILFNGPMVRATLEGRKTVTRRPVKGDQIPRLTETEGSRPWVAVGQHDRRYGFVVSGETEAECARELAAFGRCPYGRRGDRLWVRETWGLQVRRYGGGTGEHIVYRATNPDAIYCKSAEGQEYPVKWKPSIHMPRHSSRILLEITDVRVERLQDINDNEIEAEGIDLDALADGQDRYDMCHAGSGADGRPTLRTAWRHLWESTGGDWNVNPWVWVVEFRRVQP
ncbi:Phage protein [Pseudomonas chlororaphis subsp. aureofaciens]|uniref:hypothetical protein n=1 Tax=Pseudomonas chlororaphis TaxID=587753 RepID=UPI000F576D19|nr:hypothetical protein [Pseudomonas chlororaphis]AZD84963.1 Phage protein [Pseudomonas chlororaphis subsp. aureofaciens]